MYISIDVGGTKMLVCAATSIDQRQLPEINGEVRLKTENNFELDMNNLDTAIKELTAGDKLEGLFIGLPGTLSEDSSEIVSLANLSTWDDKNIKKLLEDKYKCTVVCGHDAATAGWGEFTYGGIETKEAYYIAWGTGVSGCTILNGGARVAEFGWQIVNGEYLELLIGGINLPKRFGKPAAELNDEEWDSVLKDLAVGVNNVVATCDLKYFIIGGGVGAKQAGRIPRLLELTNEVLSDIGEIEIVPAKLGEMAAIYGGFHKLISSNG